MKRAALVLLLLSGTAQAWDFDASLEIEGRDAFALPEFKTSGAIAGRAELYHRWDRRRQRFTAEVFFREDDSDASRSHGDIREFYYHNIAHDAEIRIGARRVYWGVTESRHLVDIINQTDFVEDLLSDEKLGQPMVNPVFISRWGTLDLFLMPYARARTFAGVNGLPRLPFPVAANEAQYASLNGQKHLDAAARWFMSVGGADIGISWFSGLAREPDLLACLARGSGFDGTEDGPNCDPYSAVPDPGPIPDQVVDLFQDLGLAPTDEAVRQQILAAIVLVPRYDLIDQAGLDAQYVIGAVALKLEATLRRQDGHWNKALVSGFEYTIGDIFRSGADLGLLAEYLYDERGALLSGRVDDDWFAGFRIGLNDVAGTQILAGGIFEADGGNRFISVEASRRLGNAYRVELEARVFSGLPENDPLAFLADQDYLRLRLTRYF